MPEAVTTYMMPLAAGMMLAAATGLRAFLPICAVSWLAYLDVIRLNASFEWMDSLPAVIAFSVAVVFEVIGDKVPVVDHVLDVIGVFVKPVAALVLVAASLTETDTLYAVIFGLIGGASVATGVHLLKAKGRVVANAATFGVAAPVVSAAEDAMTAGIVITAIFLPLLALALVVVAVIMLIRLARPRFRTREAS